MIHQNPPLQATTPSHQTIPIHPRRQLRQFKVEQLAAAGYFALEQLADQAAVCCVQINTRAAAAGAFKLKIQVIAGRVGEYLQGNSTLRIEGAGGAGCYQNGGRSAKAAVGVHHVEAVLARHLGFPELAGRAGDGCAVE